MTVLDDGNRKRSIELIRSAIDMFDGSVLLLAEAMKVDPQIIYHWAVRGLPPSDFALKMCMGTDNRIKAEEVCRPEDVDYILDLKKFFPKVSRRRKDYGKGKKVLKKPGKEK